MRQGSRPVEHIQSNRFCGRIGEGSSHNSLWFEMRDGLSPADLSMGGDGTGSPRGSHGAGNACSAIGEKRKSLVIGESAEGAQEDLAIIRWMGRMERPRWPPVQGRAGSAGLLRKERRPALVHTCQRTGLRGGTADVRRVRAWVVPNDLRRAERAQRARPPRRRRSAAQRADPPDKAFSDRRLCFRIYQNFGQVLGRGDVVSGGDAIEQVTGYAPDEWIWGGGWPSF